MADMYRARALRNAFTLVEILIVLMILAILATLIIPRFSSASTEARETALKDDLRYLRTQVLLYKSQHREVAPGYPNGNAQAAPTAQSFTEQMTMYSNAAGDVQATKAASHPLGPYIMSVPKNPLNGKDTVLMVPNNGTRPAPTSTYGWIYKPSTQEFWADSPGLDGRGVAYVDY